MYHHIMLELLGPHGQDQILPWCLSFPLLDSEDGSASSYFFQSYRPSLLYVPMAGVTYKTFPKRNTWGHDPCASCHTDLLFQAPILSWGLGKKGPCCLQPWPGLTCPSPTMVPLSTFWGCSSRPNYLEPSVRRLLSLPDKNQ